jgi:hypothetical protein
LARLGQDAGEILTPGQADVVAWDPTLSLSSGRQPPVNNGCPDQYFAQYVGIGEPGAITVPGKTYAVRCRLMATTTADTIVSESGITAREAMDVYTGAVADTYRQVKQGVSFGLSWLPWVLIPAAVIVAGVLVMPYLRPR